MTNSKIIKLSGLTIDLSEVKSIFASDGHSPQWSGKAVLTFSDAVAKTTTIIFANWCGVVESKLGTLCDFEAEPEGSDPIYEACLVFEPDWSRAISESLGIPTRWEAHCNDIADRKARGIAPFDRK